MKKFFLVIFYIILFFCVTGSFACFSDVIVYETAEEGGETSDYLPAHVHDYEANVTNEVSCTQNGVTLYVCSVCKASYTVIQGALGHNYESAVTEPTCTKSGYTTYTCTRCNDTYTGDNTEAKGHISGAKVQENVINVTCTENGSYNEVVYCSVCDVELSREHKISLATGHKFVDGICVYCGKIETENTAGLQFSLNEDKKGYTVTGYTGTFETVYIRSYFNGLPVTAIGSNAFSHCENLISITIPSEVTEIGGFAFFACPKLVEVINFSILDIKKGDKNHGGVGYYALTVHNGESKVKEYGDYLFITGDDGENYLFGYVGGDTALALPTDYNGESYEIAHDAFSGLAEITGVTIGNAVTAIGKSAFSGCKKLASVNMGKNVTEIRDNAFYDCVSLTEITLSDSIKSVGDSAFWNCKNLVDFAVGNGLEHVGYRAFYGCAKLNYNEYKDGYYLGSEDNLYAILVKIKLKDITFFEINDGTKVIYESAFSYCAGLNSITLPADIKSVGDYAFSYCTGLVEIVFKDGISELILSDFTLGAYAFKGCYNLESITLPATVKKIKIENITDDLASAIEGCDKLKIVNYAGNYEAWKSIDGVNGLEVFFNTLYCNGAMVGEGGEYLIEVELKN